MVSLCSKLNLQYIDNRNINASQLFKDRLHLVESGKANLANNFISNLNNFLLCTKQLNVFIQLQSLVKAQKLQSKLQKLNIKSIEKILIGHNDPCDTSTYLSQLRIKNVNRLIIGHLNINSISGKFDQLKSLIEKILMS